MEFDKSRCYSAINADELRAGDRVIVADSIGHLKRKVENCTGEKDPDIIELWKVGGEDSFCRFRDKNHEYENDNHCFALAYLVERKENCTNCVHRESERCKPNVSPINRCPCYDREVKQSYIEPKTEQKAEKKYRPFANTDELVKVWEHIKLESSTEHYDIKMDMPLIWVRYKMNQCGQIGILITKYEKNYVQIDGDMIAMYALMADYEFLDGSPCGVEE